MENLSSRNQAIHKQAEENKGRVEKVLKYNNYTECFSIRIAA